VLTDTHCHLDITAFDPDRQAVIKRAAEAGLRRILIPGLDVASSRRSVQLATDHPCLYAAVGIHPTEIDKMDSNALGNLRSLAEHKKVVAIGEIGLDYYWVKDEDKRARQRESLQEQLELARGLNMPVIIHLREAGDAEDGSCAQDLLLILERWIATMRPSQQQTDNAAHISGKSGRAALVDHPGVLHSFSASAETATRAISLGFYIGVTGPVTYKNTEKRRQVIAGVPLERLLIETDAPFLAPVPHHGTRNEPAFVAHIADKIAEIHSCTPQEVAAVTTRNAARLFNWGETD
jgi:TatD DNase family protein